MQLQLCRWEYASGFTDCDSVFLVSFCRILRKYFSPVTPQSPHTHTHTPPPHCIHLHKMSHTTTHFWVKENIKQEKNNVGWDLILSTGNLLDCEKQTSKAKMEPELICYGLQSLLRKLLDCGGLVQPLRTPQHNGNVSFQINHYLLLLLSFIM